jgi:hypothetical protein
LIDFTTKDCFAHLVRLLHRLGKVSIFEVLGPVDALSFFAESCGFVGIQDYSPQRPSQELVAKDLQGTGGFRHTCRGKSTNTDQEFSLFSN